MYRIIFICTFILFTLGLQAQPGDRPEIEERIKALRVAEITSRLDLTPEESAAFWPLYNAFNDERKALEGAKRPKKDYASMSEEDIRKMLDERMEIDQKLLDLRKKYLVKMLAILPARKVAELPRAEREFKRTILERIREKREQRQGFQRRDRGN